MYYDREGNRITMDEWCQLSEQRSYKVIDRTEFHDGSFISTVWLGLDHGALSGQVGPIIFETLDFPENANMVRYATEAEAREGHAAAVAEHLAAHPELRN